MPTMSDSKMAPWGTGFFENTDDIQIINSLTKQSGIIPPTGDSFLFPGPVNFRRRLDEGSLEILLTRYLPFGEKTTTAFKQLDESEGVDVNRSDGYRLCVLGAVMMHLGARLPSFFRHFLNQHHASVGLSAKQQNQMKQALNRYRDGQPHDFKFKESAVKIPGPQLSAQDKAFQDAGLKKFGFQSMPNPMLAEASRFCAGYLAKCEVAGDLDQMPGSCGQCGKKNAADGGNLRPCSLCGVKVYCSSTCELAHRPKHKLVCNDPFYVRMAAQGTQKYMLAREAGGDPFTCQDALRNGDFIEKIIACGYCGERATHDKTLLRCNRCKGAWYCGKECQKEDWNMHKKVCKKGAGEKEKNKPRASDHPYVVGDVATGKVNLVFPGRPEGVGLR